MAGFVALLLGEVAEIDDLMTIRHAHGSNQTQWTKKHRPTALAGLWKGDHELLVYWTIKEMKGAEVTRGAGHTKT